jgi:8-oxo-dGTP pyrophosphatase MutT (NUDIX family)
MTWLSALVGARVIEEAGRHQQTVAVPITFAPIGSADYETRLRLLADAYDRYAVAVRRRWLLRSAAGPLVSEEYECARATARQLRRWSSFRPVPPAAGESHDLRGCTVTLPPTSLDSGHQIERRVRLVAWPYVEGSRSAITFPLVAASFQPYRVALRDRPTAESDDGVTREVVYVSDPRGDVSTDPLTFDGVLTRWHGDGCRIETDRVTGRQRLHLCLAETSYFAFRATQVPEAEAASSTPRLSRLLSLNLIASDREERVFLVQRSDFVVHPGAYAGTVSGNCELVSREGVHADVDSLGLPDVLAAITREAREELGIDLSPNDAHLEALGVVEIDSEHELGTHVLVATALLPQPADVFQPDRAKIDTVEGEWEIGDTAMIVDLPSATESAAAAQTLVAWLRSTNELTPHAVGALLLLVIARQQLKEQQVRRAHRAHRPRRALGWTTDDLATWLREPPLAEPVEAPGFVHKRPLFRDGVPQ